MDIREEALRFHEKLRGKIEICSKAKISNSHDLSLAYTPGVAEPCIRIAAHPELLNSYTSRGNMIAVVTDGSAVLGLGNIGPRAALPVMEGKAVLFKIFAGVDAFPVCIDSQDVDELVRTVELLEPSFGGVNLEDISAPRCFEIESRLKAGMSIPIFHDDQHGTAVVTLAAVINALKVVGRDFSQIIAVINGSGAAGIAIAKLLIKMGAGDIIICDKQGAIYQGRQEGMTSIKEEIAAVTNRESVRGDLAAAIKGRNLFIGVSAPGVLTTEMVKSMDKNSLVFAMANPDPEIMPEAAIAGGAAVVGTGRSDFPNQINNVLGFPGIFRGALDVEAADINEHMKLAAASALAGVVPKDELSNDYIVPKALDLRVAPAVASAVARAAQESGVARKRVDPNKVANHCRSLINATEDV